MSKTANNKGVNKPDLHPLSINFGKEKRFNKNFDAITIKYFEYIIYKFWTFGFNEFYHSDKTISENLRIGITRVKTIREKLIQLELINCEVKKRIDNSETHFYNIDFDNLLNKLDILYKPEYIDFMKESYIDYFNSNNYTKFKTENKSNKNTKYKTENKSTIKQSNILITLDEWKEKYLEDINSVNELLKIKKITNNQLNEYLNTFTNELKTKRLYTKTEDEFNSYFINWLNSKIKNDPGQVPHVYLRKIS